MALSIFDKYITSTTSGATIGSAIVTVTKSTGGLAVLYDARLSGSIVGNPFTADPNGRATFYLASGRYNITATDGVSPIDYDDVLVVDDPANDIKISAITTFAAIASTPMTVGQIITVAQHTSGGLGGGDFMGFAGSVTNDGGMQINSATANVYAKRINYTKVTVEMFGALGNGVNDDFQEITLGIDYLASINGGQLWFPPRTTPWLISGELLITESNIILEGAGCARFHDGGAPKSGTSLKCTGGGIPMVTFKTIAGASNPIRTGGGIRNMDLNGNGLATIGLLVRSWRGAVFEDVFSFDVTVSSFQSDALSAGAIADAPDVQRCRFTRCCWRNIDSAGVRSAHGMTLSGDAIPSSANTSFNVFEACDGQCYNGINWLLQDADANIFMNCRAFRTNGTAVAGLEIRAPAEANHFISFSCGGANGIRIKGIASGYASDPKRNSFYAIDDNNGTLYPTLDAGCLVSWHSDKGVWEKQRINQLVLGANDAQLNAEIVNLTSETLRIRNGSGNHAILTDGTNIWGFNIDGLGDVRFSRLAGTGIVNTSGGRDIYLAGNLKQTAAPTAPASGTWSVGDRSINSAPAVGSPKGWICTVAGTPGTWVSEGNL